MLAQQPKSFFLPYLKNILSIYESFLPLLLIGLTIPENGAFGASSSSVRVHGILLIQSKRTLIDDLAHLQMPKERNKRQSLFVQAIRAQAFFSQKNRYPEKPKE